MIVAVTFNPAIDKTAYVKELIPGGLNRLGNIQMDAGGKGINVSKTIQALSGSSVCTGFLAGNAGIFIKNALNALGIAHDFVEVEGETRTNLKVLNEKMDLTELNEPGPAIRQENIAQLLSKIRQLAQENCLVVLSGNTSPGVLPTVYQKMILALRKEKIECILDADGELFAQALKASPAVLKPNRFELAQYFGKPENISNEEVIALAKQLLNAQTKLVAVSMGEEGSIFLTKDQVYQADALKIDFKSAVGAGDAMVAAMAYGLDAGLPLEEIIRLAVAASAGACLSSGTAPAPLETVKELEKHVQIRKIEG